MSTIIEDCLPVFTVGSIALTGLSIYEDGKIGKKEILICSIPLFLGGVLVGSSFLIKKLMLDYLETKYNIYERDVEVHLGLFILE